MWLHGLWRGADCQEAQHGKGRKIPRWQHMTNDKIKKVIQYLTDIRDVAAISEGTDWYAMMAQKALDELKDSTA